VLLALGAWLRFASVDLTPTEGRAYAQWRVRELAAEAAEAGIPTMLSSPHRYFQQKVKILCRTENMRPKSSTG
jgi:hypothetical protein